ncbi:sugar ABC transporter, permease protein, putative [Candidatus Vecturithrix granuli]|uniref:Sugar ABC transporter, permease protein, putative n=1 Tax=Vecturithrix granuli TaxID=1499967 RepID=A0A0S6WAH5_VECG1|nr:sugar ABC transporter, permease protein, putative [Candidatus Vecturithrix granuli]
MNAQLKMGWFEKHTQWLLLVPTVLLLLALTIYPLIYSLIAMLHTVNVRTGERTFVGLQNFVEIAKDTFFWNALKNTAIYTGVGVAIEFLIGLGLAVLLTSDIKGRGIFRSLLLSPMMLPPIVAAVIFKVMYIPDFGVLNWLLGLVGISGIVWESSADTALMSLIIVDVWEWTPFMFLILLAGLQAIPLDPYEAAEVDGANHWQIFRDITFPLLKPAILIALLLRIMDTLRIFDQVFIMTGGGPANATETMSMYIYRHAFRFSNVGYATALSFIMLILTTIVSNIFIARLKTEEVF